MAAPFFEEKRPHNGLTYDEYFANTEKVVNETDESTLSDEEKVTFNYKKLNYRRSLRVQKTFKPSEEVLSMMQSITKKQLWMVITEDWCGDSAQNLPYIAKLSELSDNVDLRIVLRDSNLDIMDMYLTNGTARSIPKLVAFDEEGNELFQWGPRPKVGQDMVNQWKAEGLTKDEFIEKLQLWYAKNKGEAIINEFKELLK